MLTVDGVPGPPEYLDEDRGVREDDDGQRQDVDAHGAECRVGDLGVLGGEHPLGDALHVPRVVGVRERLKHHGLQARKKNERGN